MLTRRDLNRTLLLRQHLLARTAVPALEMVEHLVGLQAQENLSPYLSLAARLDGFHPEELSGPGKLHEPAGEQLLLRSGVEPRLARFAATHGSWTAAGVVLEDLLVSLADKVWKAKRVVDLEQLLVERLVAVTCGESWQAFLALDDFLTRIADGADDRLAFQNGYPIRS